MNDLLNIKPIDPVTQGLLSAAFSGLSAAGPSRTPVSLGQIIGQAGNAGMGAYGQAQQQNMANAQLQQAMKMQQLQARQLEENFANTAQQRDAIKAYSAGLPDAERLLFMANPNAYLQSKAKAMEPFSLRPGEQRYAGGQAIAQAPESFTLSPGQARVAGGQMVAALPERPQTETDATGVRRYINGPQLGEVVPGFSAPKAPEGFTRGPDGSLRIDPGFLAGKKDIAAAGAPRNNVTIRQEGEEAKTVGKYFGDQYGDIQRSGFNSQTTISKLNRLQSLLDGVNTGKLTPAMTEVSALADSLGIKIDKNLGPKQAARALASEVALEMRNPSGGAGMPGALSDKDREFLVQMTPNLANTPEGNKILIDTRKKLAQRDAEVARLARAYRGKNKSLDEGFFDELARFSEANPLFPTKKAGAASIQEQADAILRGGNGNN